MAINKSNGKKKWDAKKGREVKRARVQQRKRARGAAVGGADPAVSRKTPSGKALRKMANEIARVCARTTFLPSILFLTNTCFFFLSFLHHSQNCGTSTHT
jgi:hypothetical protein